MANDSVTEPAPPPSARAHGVRRRQGLPRDAALIVAEGEIVPLLELPCDAWGLLIVAIDFVRDTGELDLFAGQLLAAEPEARRHDGDVVVQLVPAVTVEVNLVDARILVARGGVWECADTRRGLDVRWPRRIASLVSQLMNREAVSDPLAVSGNPAGATAPRLVVRRTPSGRRSLALPPSPRPGSSTKPASPTEAFASLTVGGSPGPPGALTALGHRHQNGWEHWFRARDGARLSALRTAVGINPPARPTGPRGPDLGTLVAAGVLRAGDELRYVRRVKGEVHTARVLEDGQLQLADGSHHRTPSAAIRAACDEKVSEGWRTWRRVKDDRTLLELREDYSASRKEKL